MPEAVEGDSMSQPLQNDLELAREFRRRVAELLGPRLLEVRLFGSRARGEGNGDSDLDLFVLIDQSDRQIQNLITDEATDLNLELGFEPYLAPLIMDQKEFDSMKQRQRRLVQDVVREGISV